MLKELKPAILITIVFTVLTGYTLSAGSYRSRAGDVPQTGEREA